MRVPFIDLTGAYEELRVDIDAAVHRVLSSGAYILGREVDRFEAEYAAYTEARHAVGVANGLEALVLALRALGIGPGDEVLVPANTYIATWLAVSEVGATPVGVEPDPSTRNIDIAAAEALVGPRTTALIVVHLHGQPADLDAARALAERRGLALIEDAAQCHGARHRGARIGAHSDAVAWSFYPTKNLGAMGDAGAVTTNRADVADKIRVLRNYGSRVRYYNEVRGKNCRLDELQAAILLAKLPRLDEWNARRQRLAARYAEHLRDIVQLPAVVPDSEHVYHLFVVDHPRRDELQRHLAQRGIAALIHYPVPPHLSEAYRDLGLPKGAFPITERAAETHLSLPIGPHMPDAQADYVIDSVRSFSPEPARR
ncbi:MAG TPA: DegT/DnrJ/EryC1/StrS family aminotransferase [Polyangiaceae bacterium]